MPRLNAQAPITALIYTDGALAAAILRRIADALTIAGVHCSGFIQHDQERADRPRCDMFLVDVGTGERFKISEDRGPLANGCRLDSAELLRALVIAKQQLTRDADVLILNKFGKSESEGQGFRPLLAEAIERGVHVVIAVPVRSLESWREFAGDLAQMHEVQTLAALDGAFLLDAVGLALVPA